jgi:hypothetical protein
MCHENFVINLDLHAHYFYTFVYIFIIFTSHEKNSKQSITIFFFSYGLYAIQNCDMKEHYHAFTQIKHSFEDFDFHSMWFKD